MRDYFTCPPLSAAESKARDPSDGEAPGVRSWAALLEWAYLRNGMELPRLRQLKPEQLPQRYRRLLAHSADMTPTLEQFFRKSLGLTVLSRDLHGDSYRREVVLSLGREKRPVLYGAIRILLSHLPAKARESVLSESFPLGHILQTEAIPHMSWPQTFFEIESDSHLAAMLRLPRSEHLYGRRNVLVDGSRRLVAEVIEVLAPVGSSTPAELKIIRHPND